MKSPRFAQMRCIYQRGKRTGGSNIMKYTGTTYRPPYEANSLLVQVT